VQTLLKRFWMEGPALNSCQDRASGAVPGVSPIISTEQRLEASLRVVALKEYARQFLISLVDTGALVARPEDIMNWRVEDWLTDRDSDFFLSADAAIEVAVAAQILTDLTDAELAVREPKPPSELWMTMIQLASVAVFAQEELAELVMANTPSPLPLLRPLILLANGRGMAMSPWKQVLTNERVAASDLAAVVFAFSDRGSSLRFDFSQLTGVSLVDALTAIYLGSANLHLTALNQAYWDNDAGDRHGFRRTTFFDYLSAAEVKLRADESAGLRRGLVPRVVK
jgi:hypothetical protein